MLNKRSGIVLELQKDCLDSSVSTSTILRKAKVIASKLSLKDLGAWIDSELDGYQCGLQDLPPHRKGIGAPKFHNPYNGWCPIMTDDGWFGKTIRTVFLPQPISQLESLAADGNTDTLVMGYDPVLESALQKQLPMPMECGLHFSKDQVRGAIDFVRNKALQWALELEGKGIIGEEFSFDDSQKEKARTVTNHIYGSNIGVLGTVAGDVQNSGFNAAIGDLDVSQVKRLAPQIREALPALPDGTRENVEATLTDLEAELKTPSPSQSKLGSALMSIRSILEGTAGNLAASGILAALSGAGV